MHTTPILRWQHPYTLLALVLFVAGSVGFTQAQPHQFGQADHLHVDPRTYRSASGRHKVIVRDTPTRTRFSNESASARVDYEGFTLLDVDTATLATLGAQVEIRDDFNLILLNAETIDTSAPLPTAFQESAGSFSGKRLRLVQFVGPIRPEWYDELTSTGVQIVGPIPQHAYLVYGDEAQLAALASLAAHAKTIQWEGPFRPIDRIYPTLSDAGDQQVAIQLIRDPQANADTMALIDTLRQDQASIQQILEYTNIIVTLPASAISRLADQPDVLSIQPYAIPTRNDERQDQIIAGNRNGNLPATGNYLNWLASQGFTQAQFDASGFVVDVSDSGVDNGTTSPNHFALYTAGTKPGTSRMAYARLEGTPSGSGSTLTGIDGHGTINAHIVGGYVPNGAPYNSFPHADGSGFRYGLGVAPFVRVGSSVIFDNSGMTNDYTAPDFADLQARAYRDGARISSDSWGSNSAGAYTTDSQLFDILVRDAQPTAAAIATPGNQEMVMIFAAGNTGSNLRTVGSPATAKNVITVGASEGVQPFGGSDACGISNNGSNSLSDIISFSSRGPTVDNRQKPDLVAPGTHITGGVFQGTNPGLNGAADSSFTANGICRGVAGSADQRFYPDGQQWYTASSGTSHSTPAVAGAAALIRQFFINRGLPPPSPAMTKAYLTNGASYMDGAGANDTLFSNNQGMGLLNLAPLFDQTTARLLLDQGPTNTFSASGNRMVITGRLVDPAKPLRISLAWTDAPGTTVSAAYINDLNLRVQVGSATYLGNVFSGANSITGGGSDSRNNLESVFLPAGLASDTPITITIEAASITGDGIPNNGGPLDQDFALVASNVSASPVPASILYFPFIGN
ncbi:MAG: S8 family serine peptidase [Roseiflexaceae bacterium]|nr:S8 family serine peptidase [Roseiflexaceae bacterium]